jgi:hypothetical protein
MESPERSELRVFDYDHGVRDIGVRRPIWFAEKVTPSSCFRAGIETHRLMEQEVRIYSAANTVIDCFRLLCDERPYIGI